MSSTLCKLQTGTGRAEGRWRACMTRQADAAFAAELKALVNLTRPNTVVPFLGAGVSLYFEVHDVIR